MPELYERRIRKRIFYSEKKYKLKPTLYYVERYTACNCPICDEDAHWTKEALLPKDQAEQMLQQ